MFSMIQRRWKEKRMQEASLENLRRNQGQWNRSSLLGTLVTLKYHRSVWCMKMVKIMKISWHIRKLAVVFLAGAVVSTMDMIVKFVGVAKRNKKTKLFMIKSWRGGAPPLD
jgi:hypothetical protein